MRLFGPSLLFIFLCSPLVASGLADGSKEKLTTILSQSVLDHRLLDAYLISGKMNGFFTTDQILDTFSFLADKYKANIQKTAIGKTKSGNEILVFHFSNNLKSEYRKSKVLFTALHHAREVMSGNMMVKLAVQILHGIIHGWTDLKFFVYCDILMVPVINIDGHRLISDSFGTQQWQTLSMKRKNMNSEFCGSAN